MPKVCEFTLLGVSVVSLELRPLRLVSTCQVVMLTPVVETAVMVADVEPVMLLRAALMVVEPDATPVASPLELMVATEVLLEAQVAVEEILAVVPSL